MNLFGLEVMSHSYPEAYSKGSQRLQEQAIHSPMAQAFHLGRAGSQHESIRVMHNPSCNMKLRGFTIPFQNFQNPLGVYRSWQTPSGARVTSNQRVSQPSLQFPQAQQPIATAMPWNK